MFFNESVKKEVITRLSGMDKKVKLLFFTQELECQFCRETRSLLTELSELSDKIELEVKNFIIDKEDSSRFKVDKIPATLILDESGKDYGIRFFGIPSGYEFSTLLEGIILLSTGKVDIIEKMYEELSKINFEVHLQVFVTPTCPYCPQAVLSAQKLAYLNEKIKADMIEATEFPHLANKYNVRGVPRTVINETEFVEGAVPEHMLIDKIMDFLK